MNLQIDRTRFLRRALLADGVVSGLSGLILVAAPRAVAGLIGTSAGIVAAVGVSLLLYGFVLVRSARRETPRRAEAAVAVGLNVAWLLGTVAVVVAGVLTREGNWALILVGDVVLVFTGLEVVGLRKMSARGATPDPSRQMA
jgi:hypothetical protein